MGAIGTKQLAAEIVLVVCGHQDALGLERAQKAGIDTLYFPLTPYLEAHNGRGHEQYDRELAQKIQAYQPDLIILEDWSHAFSAAFLEYFPRQVINLHPALPGEFPGTDPIGQAYDAFQRGDILSTGVTVHFVVPEAVTGEVIIKAGVPMLIEDTLEDFEARIHATGHQLILKAIALYAAKYRPSDNR